MYLLWGARKYIKHTHKQHELQIHYNVISIILPQWIDTNFTYFTQDEPQFTNALPGQCTCLINNTHTFHGMSEMRQKQFIKSGPLCHDCCPSCCSVLLCADPAPGLRALSHFHLSPQQFRCDNVVGTRESSV